MIQHAHRPQSHKFANKHVPSITKATATENLQIESNWTKNCVWELESWSGRENNSSLQRVSWCVFHPQKRCPTGTNNTPSLAPSFPRSVGSWPLTLVALHNLQRITGTINGCLSDSEATARTAQVPWEILRLCCSNSTGNTPREDQVVHFSLSWWRQRKMQELT